MLPVEWQISDTRIEYPDAVEAMEARVAEIRHGRARELAWAVEHPPIYTKGTSANSAELLQPMLFPVYDTGRGGRYTYHGPGQRVVYVMLNLRGEGRRPDIRRYVRDLENWLIDTVADFGVRAFRRDGRVGVWVATDMGEAKIGALGVRVRHWVTFHGVSLNIEPDLKHYQGIVPCGVREYGVTSLVDLGVPVTMPEVDARLRANFERIFGATIDASAAAHAAAG